MYRRLVLALLIVSAPGLTWLRAQTPYPTQWQVNGNGYVGILKYTVAPNSFKVRGTLLGTPCEGVLVGRRLILHRTPRGSQVWEGWIMEPRLGAPGQPYYKGRYFIAGTISENNAGNSLYPWYGVPLGSGPPPWNTSTGGGQPGLTGGGQPGTTGGGAGGFTGPGTGSHTGGGAGGYTGGGQPGYTGGGQPGVTGGGAGYPTGHNLVVNGSFEQGSVAGPFRTLGVGSKDMPGWTITRGTIDQVRTDHRAADGYQCVDLIGSPGSGGIRQAINTVPGRTYRLSFDMAGNTDCGAKVKTLNVSIGSVRKTFRFDTTNRTGQDPGWVRRFVTFRTDSSRTVLEFADPGRPDNGLYCGAILDNVAVVEASGGPVASGGTGYPAGNSLVANGSFELGPAVGSYRMLKAGATDLPGWTVTKGTIDVVGSYIRAYDGKRSVDLAGSPGAGGIRQVLNTIPSQTYRLSFDTAGNPDAQCPDRVKTLTVRIGSIVRSFHLDATNRTADDPGWVRQLITFRTDSARTPLEFLDPRNPNGNYICGPLVDNVIVFPASGGVATGGAVPPAHVVPGAGNYILAPGRWQAHQNAAGRCSASGGQLCIDAMKPGGAYFTTRRPYALDRDYTVSFDVRLNEADNHWVVLYSDGFIQVNIDWGTALVHVNGPNGIKRAGSLTANQWHSIRAVAHPSQGTFDVYVDGAKVSTATNIRFPHSYHLASKAPGISEDVIFIGDPDSVAYRGGAYNRGSVCWRNIRLSGPPASANRIVPRQGEALASGKPDADLPGRLLSSSANNPAAYLPGGEGMLDFQGRFDDLTFLHIRGDRIYAENPKGRPVMVREFHFTQPLPAARLRSIMVQKKEGRGKVELWERPESSNNYSLSIRIEDPKGGDAPYHFQVIWQR